KRPARHDLPCDDPGHPQVAPPIELCAAWLFGGAPIRARSFRLREGRGDAKIGDPANPSRADDDVGRRDVVMDELKGMTAGIGVLVKDMQSEERVGEDAERNGLGEARIASARALDDRSERIARYVVR